MTSGASSGAGTVERLKRAVFPSYGLLAAIRIDLFTHLQDGPKAAPKLAGDMGVAMGVLM